MNNVQSTKFLQMLNHFSWKMITNESNGQFFRWNLTNFICVRLIKTTVSVHFVKIIDCQVVIGTFVFDDIVSPKNPANIFVNRFVFSNLDDQFIHLHRLFGKQMLRLKGEFFSFGFKFNLDQCLKSRMPLNRIFCTFLQLKSPFIIKFPVT